MWVKLLKELHKMNKHLDRIADALEAIVGNDLTIINSDGSIRGHGDNVMGSNNPAWDENPLSISDIPDDEGIREDMSL